MLVFNTNGDGQRISALEDFTGVAITIYQTGQFASVTALNNTGNLLQTKLNGTGNLASLINLANTGSLITNLYLGTPSATFQIHTGSSGVLLKNTSSGLHLRNYNDVSDGNLIVGNLTVQGTQTIANSNNLSIANKYIYLNDSGIAQDGGVVFLRSGNTAATLTWSESDLSWKAGFSGMEFTIIRSIDTGDFADKVSLTSTGSTLTQKTNILSGYLDSNFSTKDLTTNTGVALVNLIFNSGATNASSIASTGSSLFSLINTNTNNLTLTGVTLGTKIDNLSGYSDSTFATVVNLESSGSVLSSRADIISGLVVDSNIIVFKTGTQRISGAKTFANDTAFDGTIRDALGNAIIYTTTRVLGDQGGADSINLENRTLHEDLGVAVLNYANRWLSGDWQINTIGVTSGTIVNFDRLNNTSGAIQVLLGQTGSTLFSRDASISGGLQSNINNVSNSLIQTGGITISKIDSLSGYTNTSIYNTGQNLYLYFSGASGNLIQTGVSLGTRISTVETNLTNTGATLFTRDANISGGLQANIDAISTRLIQTGANALSNYTGLSGALIQTGVNLQGQINTLTTNLANSGVVLNARITGLSGALSITGSTLFNRDANISGGLQVNIDQSNTRINSLSGFATGTFATKTDVTTTGTTLQNRIESLSGYSNLVFSTIVTTNAISGNLIQSGVQLTNSLNTITTNLTNSGVNLINRDTSISGALVTKIDVVSGNLTATGATLFTRDSAISGGLEARITATGNAVIAHVNGMGANLSGNLAQTGVNLGARIDTLGTNLIETGAKIISLSGYVNNNFNYLPNITTSVDYTVANANALIYCNNTNPITLTFPSAVNVSGLFFKVKLINTGSVYFTGNVYTQTFDGQPCYNITVPFAGQTVHSNGSNFFLIP